MPSQPSFELASDALERATCFDRLAARGTIRLALRQAGLDARSVTPEQMIRVVEDHLRAELECRGVEDSAKICARLKARLAQPQTSQEQNQSLFSDEGLGSPGLPGERKELP